MINLTKFISVLNAGKPTDQADSISPVLRDATVDTITNLACAIEFPFNINKNNICISGKHGVSTCNVRLACISPMTKSKTCNHSNPFCPQE